ncbi:hypothetical protein FB451DRAFT_1184710 [Mycena latifolia]|nr:hypothetical protein FB451DRAFT_1184710 [Mycena latifolia]
MGSRLMPKCPQASSRRVSTMLVQLHQNYLSSHNSLREQEAEDQADELHMFSGVDDLKRWESEDGQLCEDEAQGFCDITTALSVCLGSATLILPSYFLQLATNLCSFDWSVSVNEIIKRGNAEGRDGPFSDGSLFQHLMYYSAQTEFTNILFLHRDEDEDNLEHWLLFRHSGKELICFELLATHKKICNRRAIVSAMHTVAAYFQGGECPTLPITSKYLVQELDLQQDGSACGFWSTMLCLLEVAGIDITSDTTKDQLRKLKVDKVKQYLKQMWTSWRIGEEGLEEEALNALLREFKTEHHGLGDSCIDLTRLYAGGFTSALDLSC